MLRLEHCMSAWGREPPVVTVRDFSSLVNCYAEPNGRERAKADSVNVTKSGLIVNSNLMN